MIKQINPLFFILMSYTNVVNFQLLFCIITRTHHYKIRTHPTEHLCILFILYFKYYDVPTKWTYDFESMLTIFILPWGKEISCTEQLLESMKLKTVHKIWWCARIEKHNLNKDINLISYKHLNKTFLFIISQFKVIKAV